MKKGLFSILTLSYLIFSIGIINFSILCLELNKNAEMKSVLVDNKSILCSKCGICIVDPITQEESGCCKDKTELVKQNIDQSIVKSSIKLSIEEFQLLQALLPILGGLHQNDQLSEKNLTFTTAPPRGKYVPINVLNCIYRI